MAYDPITSRDADLRVWREQFSDTVAIRDLQRRQQQVCAGVVSKIRLVPGRQLEVTVEDGTGRLTATFTGRSTLPGVELGAGLRLTGTVATGPDGEAEMLNPSWTPVSEPYA